MSSAGLLTVKNAENIDISVITIVYNDAQGLEKALESVLKQKARS